MDSHTKLKVTDLTNWQSSTDFSKSSVSTARSFMGTETSIPILSKPMLAKYSSWTDSITVPSEKMIPLCAQQRSVASRNKILLLFNIWETRPEVFIE